MKLKGNNLIVFFRIDGQWRTLAYATTCELDIQAETITVGSPDTGRWEKKKKRRLGWNGSSAHLMSDIKDEANLFGLLKSDLPVRVCFGSVIDHKSPINSTDNYIKNGKVSLEGDALITRMTITGRRGDCVTLSVSFVGIGELIDSSTMKNRVFDHTFSRVFG